MTNRTRYLPAKYHHVALLLNHCVGHILGYQPSLSYNHIKYRASIIGILSLLRHDILQINRTNYGKRKKLCVQSRVERRKTLYQ